VYASAVHLHQVAGCRTSAAGQRIVKLLRPAFLNVGLNRFLVNELAPIG
jgi:hypothetical protein